MEFERQELIPEAAVQFTTAMQGFVTDWLAKGKEVPLGAYLGTIEDGKANIMPVPATHSKDVFALLVRATAKALESDFVLLVCEAWKASATKEERDKFDGEVRDMPGASDVVYFQLECENGTWLGSARVAPWEKGKARTLGELTMRFGAAGDGRFVGLLPREQPTKH